MAGKGWNWLKLMEMTGNGRKMPKWLEMTGIAGNGSTWPDRAVNGLKLLDMAGNFQNC